MSGRPNLRLVPKNEPERDTRLEVTISARFHREPFGRSRPYRLSPTGLEELLAAARRIEGRRS
jgi:hypothetical protein